MYYTLEKTAEILEVSPGDVNRLREQGKLRAFKDGSNWKFRKEDVEKYLTDLIRERSKPAKPATEAANDLINDSDDDTPTMLGDSFDDALFDVADSLGETPAQEYQISASETTDDNTDFNLSDDAPAAESGLELAKDETDFNLSDGAPAAESGLELAKDDTDFNLSDGAELSLAKEETDFNLVDDGLTLAKDETDFNLEGDDLKLVDEAQAPVVELADDELHLNSGSGLALADDGEIDLGGDDLILSGSGSGSGLNLGSESGLSLLDADADEDFVLAPAEEEEPTTYGLAEETDASNIVLNLSKDGDEEAPTVLGDLEDGGYKLAEEPEEPQLPEAAEATDSTDEQTEGSSLFFTTDDDEDSEIDLNKTGGVDLSKSEGIDLSKSDDVSLDGFDPDSLGGMDWDSTGGSGLPGAVAGGFDGESNSLELEAIDSEDLGGSLDLPDEDMQIGTDMPADEIGAARPTGYNGKDFAFLVPCLIFVLLAAMGAYELCRTIWSYENGSFDIGGPILDFIAKTFKLI